MIRNLIFDFGKVLIDYDFMRIIQPMFRTREEAEEAVRMVLTEYWNNRLDAEPIPMHDIIEEMTEAFPKYAALIRYMEEHFSELVIGEMEGMHALLSKLKEEGFRMYGLTNWCHKCYETMAEYDIFRLLDGFIVSSDVHQIKPNPDIYLTLLDRYHLKAEECIFTDDKAINIEGARRVGIKSILFRSAEQYERELREALKEFTAKKP